MNIKKMFKNMGRKKKNVINKPVEKVVVKKQEEKQLKKVSDKVVGGELVYDQTPPLEDFKKSGDEEKTDIWINAEAELTKKLQEELGSDYLRPERNLSFKEERLFKRTGVRPK